jgi:isopenicillin-N N-acyltransferase-like protein
MPAVEPRTVRYELRQIHCRGDAAELGRQQGEAERERIAAFVDQRLSALGEYCRERGVADPIERFVATGRACLDAAERWDPEGATEHAGIASGANQDAALLYAVANMTDVRDVLLLPAPADEGCSAFILPPELTRHGELVAAQTWDLNPDDLDYIVAVHRRPARGPETWSVTCSGCLSLVGMNDRGLCVGTTNIKLWGSRPGVGYLSLLHRALCARDRAEAKRVFETAPRAAAHTYWAADAQGAVELECGPDSTAARELAGEPLLRTNHCLVPEHVARQGEPPTSSSRRRLERLGELVSSGAHDERSARLLFSDRSDGVDSINRYPEDEQGTSTNACVVFRPRARAMWACRGPADRGRWYELGWGAGAGSG